MHTVFGLHNLAATWNESSVCIGVFDGVHLGHQKVIASAVNKAHERSCPAVVLTFDRNPAALLRPEMCPKTIAPLELRMAKMEKVGADICVIANFDKAFSEQSREDFLQAVLIEKLKAAHVTVGHDFAFGKGRQGKPDWLASKLPTTVIEPVEYDGRRVSSTEIRKDIETGLVKEAMLLLGSPYTLVGTVVKGQGLASKWDIPTANIAPIFDQIHPADGIYAGIVNTIPAAISVGNRPTFPGAGFAIEAHLLMPQDNLYGRTLNVEFHDRIRDQEAFETQEALVEAMKQDIADVRNRLGETT